MKKLITASLLLASASLTFGVAFDFENPPYSDGNIEGQDGWFRIFGGPSVIVSGGALTGGSFGGAGRNLSDTELGGVFDNTSTSLAYSYDINFSAKDAPGTFNTVFDVRFGNAATSVNNIRFRRDGRLEIDHGGGRFTESFAGGAGVTLNTTYTVSGTVDYAADTFTVFLNGSPIGGSFGFIVGGNETASIRILAELGGSAVATMDNLSVGVVPEPSTYAALLGLCALGLVAWRRRR